MYRRRRSPSGNVGAREACAAEAHRWAKAGSLGARRPLTSPRASALWTRCAAYVRELDVMRGRQGSCACSSCNCAHAPLHAQRVARLLPGVLPDSSAVAAPVLVRRVMRVQGADWTGVSAEELDLEEQCARPKKQATLRRQQPHQRREATPWQPPDSDLVSFSARAHTLVRVDVGNAVHHRRACAQHLGACHAAVSSLCPLRGSWAADAPSAAETALVAGLSRAVRAVCLACLVALQRVHTFQLRSAPRLAPHP